MNVNNDPRIVVLDREQFDRLVSRAEVGDHELSGDVVDDVMRHVRRFNPAIQAEHAAQIKHERMIYDRDRAKVRALIKSRLKQTVYFQDHLGRLLIPAEVLGKATSKLSVRISMRRKSASCFADQYLSNTVEAREIPIWNILAELPDGFSLEQTGQYAGCYTAP